MMSLNPSFPFEPARNLSFYLIFGFIRPVEDGIWFIEARKSPPLLAENVHFSNPFSFPAPFFLLPRETNSFIRYDSRSISH